MTTHNLQILDFPSEPKFNGPKAFIAIKVSQTINLEKKEFEIISNECISFLEFNNEIERLINELQHIKN